MARGEEKLLPAALVLLAACGRSDPARALAPRTADAPLAAEADARVPVADGGLPPDSPDACVVGAPQVPSVPPGEGCDDAPFLGTLPIEMSFDLCAYSKDVVGAGCFDSPPGDWADAVFAFDSPCPGISVCADLPGGWNFKLWPHPCGNDLSCGGCTVADSSCFECDYFQPSAPGTYWLGVSGRASDCGTATVRIDTGVSSDAP